MYIEDFFNKYNGKLLDRDGAYGGQCMDLYNQYQQEVMGVTPRGAAYAKLVWDNYDRNHFTKILNTPEFVPQLGDVAVWTADVSNGELGHIGICTGKGDVNTFESFDQNWEYKQYCRYVWHSYYGGFAGVLRPKVGDFRKEEYTPGLYQTLYVMKVRDGVWGRVKSKSELTLDGQKNSNAAGNYLAGTNFDVLQIINHTDGSIWGKGLSGYVCIRDNSQIYCKKIG